MQVRILPGVLYLGDVLRVWRESMAAFQIDRVQIMGHIPPREMFDRAMTILHGRATEGTIRVGDLVTLPDGREMVLHGIEVFAGLQEATAPAEAALMFRGDIRSVGSSD